MNRGGRWTRRRRHPDSVDGPTKDVPAEGAAAEAEGDDRRPMATGEVAMTGGDFLGEGGTEPLEVPGGPEGDRESRELGKVARQTVFKLAGSLANAVLGLAFLIVLTRGLGKAEAGSFFVALALFTILSNGAELGADTAYVRLIARYRALNRTQDLRTTIVVGLIPVLVISTLLAALMYLFAPQLAHVFTHHRGSGVSVGDYIKVMALFLPISTVFTVLLAAIRAFGVIKTIVFVNNVGSPAARVILTGAVIAAGLGPVAVVLAWGGPQAILTVLLVVILLRLLRRAQHRDRYDRASPPRPTGEMAGEFWRFAWPKAFGGFFSTIVTWLDTLLLAGFRSTGQAGVYTASTRFIRLGGPALGAIVLVIGPQLAAVLAKGQKDRAERIFQTTTWWLMAPSWPIYLSLAVWAPFVLRIFGNAYVEGQTALAILSLASLFGMATGPVGTVLLMGGYSGWSLVDQIASLVVDVVLNLILIPRMGMNGAAIAWAASILTNNGLAMIQVKVLMGLVPFGEGFPVIVGASVLCFAGIGLFIRATLGMSVATFLLFGSVSLGLYVLILWRFRELLQFSALREAFRVRSRRGRARTGP